MSKASSRIIIPNTPRYVRDLTAFHESKHYEPEPDEVTIMICSDEFLEDIERQGNRRKIMADLGFNMEKDAEAPERIKIDLGEGYEVFDHTLIENKETGLKEPVGKKIVKGRGYGSIILQGDKHGEA